MSLLRSHCYESLVAGEAARELLMGNSPMDYDIITNCQMDRLEAIFGDYRINEDNADKGELIVTVRGMVIMVSPYRSGFDENGAPIFAKLPVQDLARRDFTMNAIGITENGELYDPFGGAECLEAQPYLLKAVGESEDFAEAVGIEETEPGNHSSVAASPETLMKALELAATGDYAIDEKTSENIISAAKSVKSLPPEQLRTSFEKILMAKRCSDVMLKYRQVIFAIFPELAATDSLDQRSEFQSLPLFSHACKSAFFAPPQLSVRYALFLHGVGKPDCEAVYPDGHASFFGHGERGVILARRALERLKMPEEQIEEILFLIRHHDLADTLKTEEIDGLLEQISAEELRRLLLVGYANLRAKKPEYERKATDIKRLSEQVLHWNEPGNNKFRTFI